MVRRLIEQQDSRAGRASSFPSSTRISQPPLKGGERADRADSSSKPEPRQDLRNPRVSLETAPLARIAVADRCRTVRSARRGRACLHACAALAPSPTSSRRSSSSSSSSSEPAPSCASSRNAMRRARIDFLSKQPQAGAAGPMERSAVVGFVADQRLAASVVLPAPFGPTMPMRSPARERPTEASPKSNRARRFASRVRRV